MFHTITAYASIGQWKISENFGFFESNTVSRLQPKKNSKQVASAVNARIASIGFFSGIF